MPLRERHLASSRCAAPAFVEPLPPQDDVAMVDVAEAAPGVARDFQQR